MSLKPCQSEGRKLICGPVRANALFNAVKKQYGLHSYLLSLDLPTPPPAPIPVPALLPRLPPPSVLESPQLRRRQPPPTPVTPNNPGGLTSPHVLNTLQMMEKDIQSTARFAREFVVMSLIPWMEKCVVEWNESVGQVSIRTHCISHEAFSVVFVDQAVTFTPLFLYPPIVWISISFACTGSYIICVCFFTPWSISFSPNQRRSCSAIAA